MKKPRIAPKDLARIEVDVEQLQIPTVDVDEEIGRIAHEFRPWLNKPGCCAPGNRLVMDYAADVGELSATGVVFAPGSNTMLPGFDEQLAGAEAGETRRVTVLFPSVHHDEKLAGKEVVFTVTIRAVEEAGKVVVTDDLSQAFGHRNARDFRRHARERIEGRYRPVLRERAKEHLLRQLCQKAKAAPELILDELCESEGVCLSEADMEAAFYINFANSNPIERRDIRAQIEADPEALDRFRRHVRREKTVDHILAHRVKRRRRKVRCRELDAAGGAA